MVSVMGVAGALFANTKTNTIEKTMTVSRCQAVLKDGSQCDRQVEAGRPFCWQHRASKAVDQAVKGVGDGSQKAWKDTKAWSTNTWESMRSGWNKAVDATKDSVKGVRKGMAEFIGGKPDSGK